MAFLPDVAGAFLAFGFGFISLILFACVRRPGEPGRA